MTIPERAAEIERKVVLMRMTIEKRFAPDTRINELLEQLEVETMILASQVKNWKKEK